MMRKIFIGVKLAVLLCLSSMASAHEVVPAIGNFSVHDTRLELTLRLNAEALLAGVDLDGLADTNEAAEVRDYDALRALPPADLTTQLEGAFDPLFAPLGLALDGAAMTPALTGINVQPAPEDLPRATVVTLVLPANDATQLSLSWPAGWGTLVLRQNGVEAPYTGTLQGGDTVTVPLAGGTQLTAWQAFSQYIPVGFDHILPKGLDHILFVLGLFFLSLRMGALLWQISAFTLAHTVTLAAGALGWVNVPASIVEPLIAASISFIAVENILARGLTPWRPVVVFGFGLLHGLGFASVLGEFGLPQEQFIPALIGFNIGVELGQLTVIAIAFVAVGAWFGRKSWYRAAIAMPASAVIALIGAYWVVERVFL